jgi:Leucine-rich repeat (LRR) protein
MTILNITDFNINDFNNCNYLSIIKLIIKAPYNINLLLDKLHKFINLQELSLSINQITEIKGLDNLVNLQTLYLYSNKITEIKGLDNLVNLQTLYLYSNQITEIKGLDNLVNLQTLYFYNNQITEIKGLDNLINLQTLYLNNNKITEIKGLDNLINLQYLYLDSNKITEIKGLDNLINLQYLTFQSNQIKEIKGLDNLINLQHLTLDSNKITKIKGLDNLINLQYLTFHSNQITEIKGLDNLVNLQYLYLNYNQITEIKGLELDNLVNLKLLNLNSNKITELPLSLCNFRNINKIFYANNPIEYIPLPVQRWLDRLNRRITTNNMVYNDNQNIHNHHIQNSFRNSLNNILKDKQLLDFAIIKQQILENNILTEQSKREILNYCDDKTTHSILLITYSDLLIYVWSRIIASANADEILPVLNQEISDGICMCFTGRLTRLLNTLVGFYDDIELQITDSEQITNIIMGLKNKFPSGDQLKEEVKKELLDRQYNELIINEWISYI